MNWLDCTDIKNAATEEVDTLTGLNLVFDIKEAEYTRDGTSLEEWYELQNSIDYKLLLDKRNESLERAAQYATIYGAFCKGVD